MFIQGNFQFDRKRTIASLLLSKKNFRQNVSWFLLGKQIFVEEVSF